MSKVRVEMDLANNQMAWEGAEIKAVLLLGCVDQKRMMILSQCKGREKEEFYAKLMKQLKVVG